MGNEFYSKFVNFLKEHALYDEKVFQYIWEQSFIIDYRDDNYGFLLGSCQLVIDNKGKLQELTPCMPALIDDKSVAIAIYTYVNSLMLIPKMGKNYKEDLTHHYVLPMFYEKLYILENPRPDLLIYEETMITNLVKDDSHKYKRILEQVDSLAANYQKNHENNMKTVKKAKRLARNYIQ